MERKPKVLNNEQFRASASMYCLVYLSVRRASFHPCSTREQTLNVSYGSRLATQAQVGPA